MYQQSKAPRVAYARQGAGILPAWHRLSPRRISVTPAYIRRQRGGLSPMTRGEVFGRVQIYIGRELR